MKIWCQVIFWISRMWKFLIQEKIKILEISRIGKYVNITYFAIWDFILYEAKNWKIREHCVLMRRGQYWKIHCFLVYKEKSNNINTWELKVRYWKYLHVIQHSWQYCSTRGFATRAAILPLVLYYMRVFSIPDL